ncbi:hypothetical protein, partial [Xanthomonas campestris]|uniref:hypothetical protein n=1 Tax=Xanthomonas campestris TaxID=339 RepID=UPI0032E44886
NRQQRSTLQPRALSVITGMAGGGRSGQQRSKRNWQVDLTYSIIFEIAMDEIFCLTAVKMSGAINFEYFLITLDISK